MLHKEDIIEGRDATQRGHYTREGMMNKETLQKERINMMHKEDIIRGRDDAQTGHFKREGCYTRRTLQKGGIMTTTVLRLGFCEEWCPTRLRNWTNTLLDIYINDLPEEVTVSPLFAYSQMT